MVKKQLNRNRKPITQKDSGRKKITLEYRKYLDKEHKVSGDRRCIIDLPAGLTYIDFARMLGAERTEFYIRSEPQKSVRDNEAGLVIPEEIVLSPSYAEVEEIERFLSVWGIIKQPLNHEREGIISCSRYRKNGGLLEVWLSTTEGSFSFPLDIPIRIDIGERVRAYSLEGFADGYQMQKPDLVRVMGDDDKSKFDIFLSERIYLNR